MSGLSGLLALLYRQRCGGCDAWGALALCGACLARWPALPAAGCHVCLEPPADCRCQASPPAFSAAYAAGAYTGVAKAAVGALKFGARRPVAKALAARLAPCLPEGRWCLVPVPLASDRRREYNQAALIAQALGRSRRWPVRDVLRRPSPSPPQKALSRPERLANMEGAFVAKRRLDGARVLLIDDVMTTGATAHWAAMALLAAGAAEVRVAVVARTTRFY